jgi:uncharacterized protein
MKLSILQIPPDGLVIDEEIPSQALDLGTPVAEVEGALRATGKATLITNALEVRLTLKGTLALTCGRCLKKLFQPLEKDVVLNVEVSKGTREIDLTDDIREEIILEYPMIPLCSEGCKGLCISCGGDLNQGPCSCHNERS